MAKFTGHFEETLSVNAPIEQVKAHFGNLDVIIANMRAAQKVEKADAQTLHILLPPQSAQGVTFQGEHYCTYTFSSPDVLEWRSQPGRGNMRIEGRARFVASGAQTKVEWKETVETEIPVNFVIGKLISPIVSHEISKGSKGFAEAMRKSLKT